MKFDFDKVVDRHGTKCLKYDFAKERGRSDDMLPLWVADMDFQTAPGIQKSLSDAVAHGIYGYSEGKDDYFQAAAGWYEKHFGWKVEKEWLIKTPGVVFALAMAVKAYTEPGDGVLIQSPVYYPFSEVIEDNGRRIVSNTLVLGEDHKYHIDFEDFERQIKENQIKLFFLCNPHNPVGRVWTTEELTRLGDICLKYQVTVVSDEIHSDFIFRGRHQVFADLKREYADITVTCTAPSKTFNLAGLLLSNIFISNRELRHKFRQQVNAAGISQLSPFGLVACETAYTQGEEWYQAMLAYVAENIAFTKEYVEKHLPGVEMVEHEGTYLVWLDFRKTGLSVEELEDLIVNRAKLWLDSGKIFGKSGEGFQRINVACPRQILEEALHRIGEQLQ